MQKTYTPKQITKTPADPAVFGFAYVREVDLDGEVIRSAPHRGTFPDTPEGRAAEYAIAADGTTRTGAEILADFGMS